MEKVTYDGLPLLPAGEPTRRGRFLSNLRYWRERAARRIAPWLD
jgi:hypothetical protein